MLSGIFPNLSTFLIAVVILAIVLCIVLTMHRHKKQGKTSCGHDCSCCGGSCHHGEQS